MKELTREEKIEDIELIIENETTHFAAVEILNMLEPPEIKVGKFYGKENVEGIYGILDYVSKHDTYIPKGSHVAYPCFQPMTPDEIKKDFEEIIDE